MKMRLHRTPSPRRLRKARIDREPPTNRVKPTGPFEPSGRGHAGDLLLFVPRNTPGYFIDTLTGGHGYAHVAVDSGEVDAPTGRRVWIEAMMDDGVRYAFQDEYGDRPFVRIPLGRAGLDVEALCACIKAMVGQGYDDSEALTLGILDNPARQICSDLVTNCLPEPLCADILACYRSTLLHPLAVVPHERANQQLRLFISPNGFAEYLGVPHGGKLHRPDQPAEPHPLDSRRRARLLRRMWRHGDAFFLRMLRVLTSL